MRTFRLIVAMLFFAAPAHAFTVRGNVVNGTTGQVPKSVKVVAVNPSGGMMEEREVEAKDGRFEITGLDPQAPIYLLRVDYDGVPYNATVRVDGADHDVTIHIYESTSSWDGISVTVPHLAASRQGDRLNIEQMFEVNNESSPPRTATGERGFFHLFLPAEMETLSACFVTSLGVPVDRTPIPTDEPGVYRIEYPIRPGVTNVGVSYQLPYASGAITLTTKVLYDLQHVFVYGVDPDIKITSPSHTLQPGEPVHGMSVYSIHLAPKNTDLTLAFEGGSSEAAPAAGHEVLVVPNDAHRVAVYAMVALLLALLGVVGATQRSASPLTDEKVLRAHYDLLVKRLARLDDLRAAEAITPDAHRAAREELATRLGALAMRMRETESAAKDSGTAAGEVAPAAGTATATRGAPKHTQA
jgi:hypothetical protein